MFCFVKVTPKYIFNVFERFNSEGKRFLVVVCISMKDNYFSFSLLTLRKEGSKCFI